MKFEITADNQLYLRDRGKIILNACPGSGKTSAIAYKMTLLTKECLEHFGAYAGVACLSFTNVAKNEIAEKYEGCTSQKIGYPHLASTIDSFINKYITLPHYHLLGYKCKRPIVMDSVDFLDDLRLKWFANKKKQPLKLSYPPHKLRFDKSGEITWDGHLPNSNIVEKVVFDDFAKTYKNWQLENGYLNNDDSCYVALRLLAQYPIIGRNLVSRFPYIIIDEAQDTSEMQYLLFDHLISCGLSNIEFVGDPYQSLYEFREARPDLFIDRMKDTDNWKAHEFTSCRRSSQKIIDIYQILRGVGSSISANCKHTTNYPVKVLKYDQANPEELIKKFIRQIDTSLSYHILVRGSKHLQMFGVKLSTEKPWKNSIALKLVQISYYFTEGKLKEAIDIVRQVYIKVHYPSLDRREEIEKDKKLREDPFLNMSFYNFAAGLPPHNISLQDWTKLMEDYILKEWAQKVLLQLKAKGKVYCAQQVDTLMFPKVVSPHAISTIHKVKGKTFNAILLLLSADRGAENLTLKDIKAPLGLPNEKQCMIYVALSRPEAISCIAVPHSVDDTEIRSVLGNEVEIVV